MGLKQDRVLKIFYISEVAILFCCTIAYASYGGSLEYISLVVSLGCRSPSFRPVISQLLFLKWGFCAS